MANEFDPYREALVVEYNTVWPDDYDAWSATTRLDLEKRLHAEPQAAAALDYVRQHTGFARTITVTEADLSRLGATH
ncbi:MAG: hypothetical protein QM811_18505 [Pirellulales bacterium]